MCRKATLEPTGGLGELLFLDTNRKLARVGRRLMLRHKCNTILMSVVCCDVLYETDNHIHSDGRCAQKVDEDDWLWLPERSLQYPEDSPMHRCTQRREYTPWYKEIFKGLLLKLIIDIYWATFSLCVQVYLFFRINEEKFSGISQRCFCADGVLRHGIWNGFQGWTNLTLVQKKLQKTRT